MKNILWLCLLGCIPFGLQAQIWADPVFPRVNEPITIYFDASQGTGGLAGCNCDVYVHTGVITDASTSLSDWKNVQTTWGVANAAWKMTPTGTADVYSWTITPSVQAYYNITAGTTVEKIAFVFRNASGNLEGKGPGGSDIYYDIYPATIPLTALLIQPLENSVITQLGATLPVQVGVSESANIQLKDNGTILTTINDDFLNYDLQVTTAGSHQVEIIITTLTDSKTLNFQYIVPQNIATAVLPAGSVPGHQWLPNGDLRLTLFAPEKDYVFVMGSFNDFLLDTDYQMKPSSTSNTTWWIDIPGLDPTEQHLYQYFVSGNIRIADPFSRLILDPFNDRFLGASTWPGLPDYPEDKTSGHITLIDEAAFDYTWQTTNFTAPEKGKLVVYELLMRDFLHTHHYQSLIDTLDYLSNLGVNAIELMPISEFEGNESWGYNPSYHKAVDKYYGKPSDLKALVDACHARGIAVIADIVFNHAFGQSPIVQLWFDGKPSSENPYFNPDATHPFSVGYDFNHESPATKTYVKNCLTYWMEEFRLDGYRYDLSKGFTQTSNPNNVGAWGNYDASRIAILKDYSDVVWSVNPEAYNIMEHFAANNEETELINYGMMVWGNNNFNYGQASMGFSNNSVYGTSYKSRGWATPSLVAYMESHDEERNMYRNLNSGNAANGYSTRNLPIAYRRIEANSNVFYSIPGAKLLWQFGELGYDYNIDFNGRVGNKPIRWDYFDDADRKRLYNVTASLIQLRNEHPVFHSETPDLQVTSFVKEVYLSDADLKVAMVANFNVTPTNVTINFQNTGTWYDYWTGNSLEVTTPNTQVTFAPGEYRLYTDKRLDEPIGGFIEVIVGAEEAPLQVGKLGLSPNPVQQTAQLQLDILEAGKYQISVMDTWGRTLSIPFTGELTTGNQVLPLNFESLSAGTYLLVVESAGKVQSLPFIKQ